MSLTLSAETSAVPTIDTQADFSENTLRVLHRILIRLRALAYEGTEPRTMGRMLDDIEYLGILTMRSRNDNSPNQIADFRLHLHGLETKYPGFGHLTAVFDEWQGQGIRAS